MEGLGAALSIPNPRDPIAFPSCEASLFVLSVEVRRCTPKQRWLDAFKRVDADDGIDLIVDLARDHGHDATARTDMKLGGASSERVLRHERRFSSLHRQRAVRIGSPDTSVLGAEGTCAGACGNFKRVRFPRESERDIPAVTASLD